MIGVVLLILFEEVDDRETEEEVDGDDMIRVLSHELKTLDLSLLSFWNISNEDIVVVTKLSSCDVVEDDDGVW